VNYETWISFVVASALVVFIPGPNIVLTVNYAIKGGKRSGFATVPGVVVGAGIAMSISLAGAGAILATSAYLFSMLKLAGALYLIWLGYSLWTAPVAELASEVEVAVLPLKSLFWQSFFVSALNPKGPAFYIAFVPQFVAANSQIFLQFSILISTFLVVATINSLFWLFFANSMRAQFRKPHAMKILNRTGASCLFLAGIFTARASRAT